MYRFIVAMILCCFGASAFAAGAEGGSAQQVFIDPTRPPGPGISVRAKQKKYSLQSILYSTTSSRSLAIINGKSYAVGDSTPFGVLERIDRDGIVVRGGRGSEYATRVVNLHRDLNKQMVAGN